MKKLLLAAIAVFGFANVNAQGVEFGVTAGFASLSEKIDNGFQSATFSESGFFFGGIADIAISDEFHVQPELLFAGIKAGNSILLPIMAKYYVAEGFNIQAGPQIRLILESLPSDFSALSLGLGAGVGYDINENFFVQGRYSLQLIDSYTGDGDSSYKTDVMTIGVGYKIN